MDTALNAEGRRQARLASRALEAYVPDLVVSSDLSRCTQTRDLVLTDAQRAHAVLLLDPLWRERGWGAAEGLHINAMRGDAAYGEERHDEFWERTHRAWLATVAAAAKRGARRVLVVSHGGTIHGTVGKLALDGFALPDAKTLATSTKRHFRSLPVNTSVTVVDTAADGRAGAILVYNNHDHLVGPAGPADGV
ncbi:histidine phosphatase superfamily [Dipodascopsis tothii]|uniref:histidine phosphatase superfamily n=1 Tax=Dipodascopsis tothii TaxID=44089 RepID=UPI0034CE1344